MIDFSWDQGILYKRKKQNEWLWNWKKFQWEKFEGVVEEWHKLRKGCGHEGLIERLEERHSQYKEELGLALKSRDEWFAEWKKLKLKYEGTLKKNV